MVAGQIVMRDGRLTRLDEAAIFAEITEAVPAFSPSTRDSTPEPGVRTRYVRKSIAGHERRSAQPLSG